MVIFYNFSSEHSSNYAGPHPVAGSCALVPGQLACSVPEPAGAGVGWGGEHCPPNTQICSLIADCCL